VRNGLIGLAVAGAIALVASGARIAGIDAWKIVLAAIGFLFFVKAGRSQS
jgi:hypothetical protein